MPQHDWQQLGSARYCDACDAQQCFDRKRREWLPCVSSICPGDERDSSRPTCPAPSGDGERTRELEGAA